MIAFTHSARRCVMHVITLGAVQDRFHRTVEGARKELTIWDGYLCNPTQHLVSDSLNLADLSFAMILFFLQRYGVTFEQYPNLASYAARMRKCDVLQATWPPHWEADGDKDWLASV